MSPCTTCNTNTKQAKGCKNKSSCQNSCDKLMVFDWLSNIGPITKEKNQYVEVRFKNERKEFFENTSNLSLQMGDLIVVEAEQGYDLGVITLRGELVKIQMRNHEKLSTKPKKIFRKATKEDLKKWEYLRKKEILIIKEIKPFIKEFLPKMKLAEVEYQGDGSSVIFYYTSEGWVDFRELVKKYSSAFRVKIKMKQIGYRQEAAKIGGIGSCGRELCCSTWLKDFRSVNVSAARYQQLSLNVQKLSGQCGKLKCCLNYELDSYLEALKDFPDEQTKLYTKQYIANCIKIDVFRKEMWFSYPSKPTMWFKFSIEKVKEFIAINQKGEKINSLEELSL